MNEQNEIVVRENTPLSAIEVKNQVQIIQQVMQSVMQNGQHYGVVPGCGNKPTLLKPGAEKIAMTFKLRTVIDNISDVKITDMGNGHRDYNVFCRILNCNGQELATGVGSCSTMESKYRYRNVSDYKITGEKIPTDAKERKAEYRKQGFGMKNVDGKWEWVKYTSKEKTENPDIADVYNTVLKMAKKRAFVDGILSATAASDIFTQDIEDKVEEVKATPAPTKEKPSTPKPVSKENEKVIGVNKRFLEAKSGKKTCGIEIDGVFYICNIANSDIIETMKSSVGQEVEITFSKSEFKGKPYNFINSMIVNTDIDAEDRF
jgi:hypothetical protein